MPFIRLFTLLFLFTALASNLFAQGNKGIIKGIVKDELGKPFAEVRFGVSGTNIGGSTAADGSYEISIDAGTHTLLFSILGYELLSKKISIKSGETKTLEVQMKSKDIELKAFEKKDD